MLPFENLTPFGYASGYVYALDGSVEVVLCVAGHFRMPAAGTPSNAALALAEQQPPPPLADEYWEDPSSSSLKMAGQAVPKRVATDIYLRGSARAPEGNPVKKIRTSIQVGSCRKEIEVIGNRQWRRGFFGLKPTKPDPFVRMPLQYERAYGGTARNSRGQVVRQEARNPVGCGVYYRKRDALHQPLPNLVMPGSRTRSWKKIHVPCGYGPIPSSWQPRLRDAGTFDQKWVEEQIPLWPENTKARHFNAASPGMVFEKPLEGGEPVIIKGMSPIGDFNFALPEFRLIAKSYYANHVKRGAMVADAVLFDTDEEIVSIFWRQHIPLGHGPSLHQQSIVRIAEAWETIP